MYCILCVKENIALINFCFICSKIDEYGFERPDDFDYKSYEVFMSHYMTVLTRRAMRWDRILTTNNLRKTGTMKRFIRKGIPAQHRGKVIFARGAHINIKTMFYHSFNGLT